MREAKYLEKFRLDGKVAVITGGLGILGKRFCSGLAEFGARVAVVDLEEGPAKQFSKELADRFGQPAIGIGCDVARPKSVQEMVENTINEFGEINILHNNAASKSSELNEYFASFEDYSYKTWREVMEVNLDGYFLVAQAVGKKMVGQASGGSIIQTASIYGIMAPDQRIYEGSRYLDRPINTPAVYSVSKAGVVGLTRYLATYWANQGIRVNTLTPGGVESGQNDEFTRHYSHRVPLGRMGRGDEMVGALIYLASDASSYMTGQNIVIDGGLTAW